MLRFSFLLSLAVAIVTVLVLWFVYGGSESLPARFALEDCRRVALHDARSGKAIAGAEDLALLPDGDTLVVSALNRSDQIRPFGGLFGVSLLDLARGGDEVTARKLVETWDLRGGVHPHGIALDPAGERLAVVNRIGPENRAVIDILEWGDGRFRPVMRAEHEAYCRANDLAFDFDGDLLITRDRARCEGSIVDWVPFHPTGLLLTLTPEGRLAVGGERYFFPNGIAMGPTGLPVIAETRAARLVSRHGFVPLPGGPDNLTVDDQGAVIAAVHPSPWWLFLYRNGLAFSSPSRVVRTDPDGGAKEVLFEDPGGDILSAVSVGLMHDGGLYMGSLIDEGIAVCQSD